MNSSLRTFGAFFFSSSFSSSPYGSGKKKSITSNHHLCSSTSLGFIFIFVPDSSYALRAMRALDQQSLLTYRHL
jgi:hypothetical protein